jgi:hypothetical protein
MDPRKEPRKADLDLITDRASNIGQDHSQHT